MFKAESKFFSGGTGNENTEDQVTARSRYLNLPKQSIRNTVTLFFESLSITIAICDLSPNYLFSAELA